MLIERQIIKSFRGETAIIFLGVAITAYALTSNIMPVLMIFVGLLIALLLLNSKNIIYTLQLDEIGFCFSINQKVKYQYSWSEIKIVKVEAEYGGWQYEVTVFITHSSIGKTLPIYLTHQEVRSLRIYATKWAEASMKIEVGL